MAGTKAVIPSQADIEKRLQEINTDFPVVFEIRTDEEYDAAGVYLRNVKGEIKRLDDLRKSMTHPIDEAKTRVMALFRPKELELKSVESGLKTGLTRYVQEQERKRLALEAKLRDQQAKEQARLEERARKADDAGNENKAEELRSRIPPVPVVISGTSKLEGVAMRTTWKAEVVDFAALVRAAAEDESLLAYLEPNESALNGAARAMKGTAKIPGIKVYEQQGIAVRA